MAKAKTTRRWPYHVSAYVSDDTRKDIERLREARVNIAAVARDAIAAEMRARVKALGRAA